MTLWPTRTWETSLPAAECRLRLAHYAEPDSFWRAFRFDPKGTVYSSIRAGGFRLFAKGPTFVRNSFEPYFYGSVIEVDGKTLIRGHFRMHPFVALFMAVWFLGVAAIGALITAVMLYELVTGRRVFEAGTNRGLAILIPGMLAVGFGLVAFGWRIGRGQRQRIERFLETTLQAHQI